MKTYIKCENTYDMYYNTQFKLNIDILYHHEYILIDNNTTTNIKDYYFISSDNELPEPLLVATGQVAEAHESVLVRINNAICTDDNYPANYYMWTVNDGTGDRMSPDFQI